MRKWTKKRHTLLHHAQSHIDSKEYYSQQQQQQQRYTHGIKKATKIIAHTFTLDIELAKIYCRNENFYSK